jgi:hypothetical protein
MVTTGFLPSRDTCTWPRPASRPVPGLTFSLYIVGEGRKQDAEASPASVTPGMAQASLSTRAMPVKRVSPHPASCDTCTWPRPASRPVPGLTSSLYIGHSRLPASRDTCTSLYIVAAGSRSYSKIYCTYWINNNPPRVVFILKSPFPLRWTKVMNGVAGD